MKLIMEETPIGNIKLYQLYPQLDIVLESILTLMFTYTVSSGSRWWGMLHKPSFKLGLVGYCWSQFWHHFRLLIYMFDICFVTFWHVFYHATHYLAPSTTAFFFMQVLVHSCYFMILLVNSMIFDLCLIKTIALC